MTEEFQKNKEKAKELRKQLDEIQESLTNAVIIDGVNVAGCEHHLSTGYCQLQMIFQGMVLKLPFGKHLECNLCDKDCYYKQLKRLEQENKELRQQYNCYACDTCQGKEDYRNMKRHCENAIKTVHAYRSALEEIKEFAEPIYEQIPDDKVLRQILLKISEVLK